MTEFDFDACVVGAVGLARCFALTKRGLSVVVLEKIGGCTGLEPQLAI